eukprot:COSAG01_NODE_28372_length_662_cov_1.937833_1_plen_44_part_10
MAASALITEYGLTGAHVREVVLVALAHLAEARVALPHLREPLPV